MKSQFTKSDTIPPSLTNYMFTGKELDDMTGLYYYGARYYDPRMSVWQSPDPALESYLDGKNNNSRNLSLYSYADSVGKVLATGMNKYDNTDIIGKDTTGIFDSKNLSLYSYSFNNPVVYLDPNGLDSHKVAGNIPGGFSVGFEAGDQGTSFFASYGASLTDILPGSYEYSPAPQEEPPSFQFSLDYPSFDESGGFTITDPGASATISTPIFPWLSPGDAQPWNPCAP
jgi:RHS repeat-associated protein